MGENWRYAAEMKWREELRMKEIKLREAIEDEVKEEMKSRSEEIRRAYEESAKMEIRLKNALDNVERQKARLLQSEEQVGQRLAQKTAELQLLQRRVRDEAKSKVETEQRKADVLSKQLQQAQHTIERMHRRISDTEKDFDEYRQAVRGTPEQMLREQVASLKASLAQVEKQIMEEKAKTASAELEKEHFRSTMHRVATALKREREKASISARQELEQLRLEFLAREERYILDGDRDELRGIRKELAALRAEAGTVSPTGIASLSPPPKQAVDKQIYQKNAAEASALKGEVADLGRVKKHLSTVLDSGLYEDENDPLVKELMKTVQT